MENTVNRSKNSSEISKNSKNLKKSTTQEDGEKNLYFSKRFSKTNGLMILKRMGT
jgi:hypothetical protein